jgi:small subunit ribosomal protein S17
MIEKVEDLKEKRLLQGKVISDKMDKTVVVEFTRTYQHPLIGKVMRSTKKYMVHDEAEQAKIGDVVEFYEGRPLSKRKRWYLARIVNHSVND